MHPVSLSQGRLYKRAEDRVAHGCTEMKSKSQTVLRDGQHGKRMAHIILVEKSSQKGHFSTTLDSYSSLKPHLLPISNLHIVTYQHACKVIKNTLSRPEE